MASVAEKLEGCPAQKEIYNYLKNHGETRGAVRTVQRSKGYRNEWQVAHGSLLYPLYALVSKGLVSVRRSGGVDYYSVKELNNG